MASRPSKPYQFDTGTVILLDVGTDIVGASVASIKVRKPDDIEVEWVGPAPKPEWNWWNPQAKELVTQWRTMPCVVDLNKDGLNDLVMLDHEGYLAFFKRFKKNGELRLKPGQRLFRCEPVSKFTRKHMPYEQSEQEQNQDCLLQLNAEKAGRSGRRKFVMVDWNLDGNLDLLVNSLNINLLRNTSVSEGRYMFRDVGPVDNTILAGHTTSPTMVDWDKNGFLDLLVGAEDGYLYYLKNPNVKE